MRSVCLRDVIFDTYIKVQVGFFTRFGYEKLVLIGNHLFGIRKSISRKELLKFLCDLLEKEDIYLERFVEIYKRPSGIEISKGSEKVICFYS